MHSSILRTLVLSLALASPLVAFADNHPQPTSPPQQQHAAAQSKAPKPAAHAKKDKAHGQAHSTPAPSKK